MYLQVGSEFVASMSRWLRVCFLHVVEYMSTLAAKVHVLRQCTEANKVVSATAAVLVRAIRHSYASTKGALV